MFNLISGGMGGAKGGSFKSTPDTLRSDDSFEMLLGLGSGRWKGLTDGLRSLYINNVPLENADLTTNFKDFVVFFADGDPTQVQEVQFKLGGGGGTSQVNTPVSNPVDSPAGPGPWVVAGVTTPNADFIDLRFIISQLFRQDKKGIFETDANLEIEMRPSGTQNWINPFLSNSAPNYNPNGYNFFGVTLYAPRINWNAAGNQWNDPAPGQFRVYGKTTSAYVKEFRIAVPNTGIYANKTWEVRTRLIQKDTVTSTDGNEERRTIQWESIAAVTKKTFGSDPAWRGLAWLQVVGKASDQLSGIPDMVGIYDTKIVKTPPSSVYNASTRQFTGNIWDGTYTLNFTSDPAWCLKDLIEDEISGISALSPGSVLDKWDALALSKYCSQEVPNGRGGTHPRFSMNLKIDQAQKADEIVQYMAGAVNALAWDSGDGKWRVKQDKPENAVALFTRDNIFGEFMYQHTDVDNRYNDYTVSFLNEESRYTEDRVRAYDQANIDAFGRKPTTVVAIGCTNRQEALRRAMFRLRVSLNETKIVNFTTNRAGNLIRPLDVIMVADTDLGYTLANSENRTTTRLKSRSGTNLELGSTVRLELGIDYKILVTYPNPNYNPEIATQPNTADWGKPTITITRNIINTSADRGDVSRLIIDTALPASVAENASIALIANNLPTLPVAYRVLEVSPQDEDNVSISALIIDSGKYAASDNVNEADILGQVSTINVPSPIPHPDGMFDLREYEGDYGTQRVLTVRWVRPGSLFLQGFKVEYSVDNGPFLVLKENIADTSVELVNPTNGTYTFKITSIDRRGRYSSPLSGSTSFDGLPSQGAPAHGYGLLNDRPATGVEGELYTATDTVPPTTFLWKNGSWVIEGTRNLDASELPYVGGNETVEDLKPAEGGATNGMNSAEKTKFDQLDLDVQAATELANRVDRDTKEALASADQELDDVKKEISDFQDDVSASFIEVNKEILGINPGLNPNLIDGGNFEDGLTGWDQNGGAWNVEVGNPTWGNYAYKTVFNGVTTLEKIVKATPGIVYTLSADMIFYAGSGSVYLDMIFFDNAGNTLYDAPQTPFPVNTSFSVSDTNRKTYKCTAQAPANTATVRIRLVGTDISNLTLLGVRRIKFEIGDKATAFSSDSAAYTAYVTAKTAKGDIATVKTTAETAGANASSALTATTALTTSLATLTNRVNASSNPNLLKNGGFENTLNGFGFEGKSKTNWNVETGSWGSYASNRTAWTATSDINYAFIYSEPIPINANANHTLAAEMELESGNPLGTRAWVDVEFYNGTTFISRSNPSTQINGGDLAFRSDGLQRNKLTLTTLSPSNANRAVIRLVINADQGTVVYRMHWRQIKFEIGSIATPYSGEATASQTFTAYSTLNSTVSGISNEVYTPGGRVQQALNSITNLNTVYNTLDIRLSANKPNLISNGSGENGTTDWYSGYGNWFTVKNMWGNYFALVNNGPNGDQYYHLSHETIPVIVGQAYTFSCDAEIYATATTACCYLEMVFLNQAGATVSQPSGNRLFAQKGFSDIGDNRKILGFTAYAPSGAVSVGVRMVVFTPNGVQINGFGFRQAKLETGIYITPYSTEASLNQTYTTLSSHTSSIASLNTEVNGGNGRVQQALTAAATANGSVATLRSKVLTGSGNLIRNSEFVTGTQDWIGQSPTPSLFVFLRDGAGTPWRPVNDHTLSIYQNNNQQGVYGEWIVNQTAVDGNKYYEFSVHLAAHRCPASLLLQWFDANNNVLRVDQTPWLTLPSGGQNLSNFSRQAIKAQAPAGAASVICYVRKERTHPEYGDSWMWLTRPMLMEVAADFQGPASYSPSGNRAVVETINQSVDGVLAKAGVTLDVNGYLTGWQMNNNGSAGNFVINADFFSILKPGGGARTEYSNGTWFVYDEQGRLRVEMGRLN